MFLPALPSTILIYCSSAFLDNPPNVYVGHRRLERSCITHLLSICKQERLTRRPLSMGFAGDLEHRANSLEHCPELPVFHAFFARRVDLGGRTTAL